MLLVDGSGLVLLPPRRPRPRSSALGADAIAAAKQAAGVVGGAGGGMDPISAIANAVGAVATAAPQIATLFDKRAKKDQSQALRAQTELARAQAEETLARARALASGFSLASIPPLGWAAGAGGLLLLLIGLAVRGGGGPE